MDKVFAAIEGGGTKFNCAIFNRNKEIVAEQRIDTTTPEVTLKKVTDFFLNQRARGHDFNNLGLACFGPLDLAKHSSTYGNIMQTPKLNWSNTPIKSILENGLKCSVSIDTDVNAAALAEHNWGASQKTDVSLYVTIGTGVGVGVVIDGKTLKGLVHPEVGHMMIPAPSGVEGQCPFHGNCVEGLASGHALEKIWGQPSETLGDDHQAWDKQAQVMAKFCHNLLVTYGPQKIILGGGVMAKSGLLENIIRLTDVSLAGYLAFPSGTGVSSIICPPGLGRYSGLMGALALIESRFSIAD